MITAELDQRFDAQLGSTNDAIANAVNEIKDELSTIVTTVVSAASKATVSVLSHTMRSLLDDLVRTVLPSIMKDAVSSGLKEHLNGVVSDAWVAALQREMSDTALLVQAHTENTVTVATIQLGSQLQTLQDRLELSSTAAAEEMKSMETALMEGLGEQINSAKTVVKDEANALRGSVESVQLSIAAKIAVLHQEVTGLFGVLKAMNEKLDSMYDAKRKELKKQTEITKVLDALPNTVRQALSVDVQRLHQRLRSHQSRARDFVEQLLRDAMTQIMTSYKEHQALQRKTEKYLSQILRRGHNNSKTMIEANEDANIQRLWSRAT
ncbi:Hypothetical protein, putative [Bodo saltans]|uniref:Uncharacterized protein n=1 Tax=Bodo saltans TaxID=75058 RepID=A0A0S4JGM2_BODSA|nr:Hypothetical protein, putative [Bodo saltans]|eukprot:CUG89329.1 Hypothetical protein, putative [Bodo saltans]